MSLTINSGGSLTLNGGSGGGGGAISAVYHAKNASATAVETASESFVQGTPNVTLTATTGTSVLVTISAYSLIASNSGAGTAQMGVAVSGATTRAVSDYETAAHRVGNTYEGDHAMNVSNTFVIENLTAGSNTFTMQYKAANGLGTAAKWYRTRLTVQTLA